ncbi:CD109 antigen-like isoform X2 [Physella acuta]|uniref:CD109 antigen-like isoform X2 n=1 Tax=Physella acuta TaxID=109671 RepID=UPI0027DB5444|nr:CD109 antigen-like isoform X2 [Physella acuta]
MNQITTHLSPLYKSVALCFLPIAISCSRCTGNKMRLLLLLTVVVTAVCAQNSYVVIAPSKIRSNMDFSVSVNILKATGDVTVVAQVLRGTTVVASGTKVFQAGAPGTIDIKLPADLPNSGYMLKVVGSGGLVFDKSESLSYNSKEASLFIQLNKAIFKPSDTVNFRVFGVYSDLKSFNSPMDISIYDAGSNKIKQWLKVTPEKGVITQELTLSSQPVLGDWKISVEAGNVKEEKVFTVAEYILPKFEVEVVMPSYVLTTDTDVTFTVKSKYTYGKPVKGTADVQVKLLYSSNTYDYSLALPVTSTQVPLDGEAKVTVPMSQVKAINAQLNGHILIVSANVTESLTGNQMSSNGTVTMYDKGVKLEYPENNPKTFKPGLQYIAYLKVSQPDGLPVSSTVDSVKVSIKITAELPGTTPTPSYWYSPPTENRDLPGQTLSVPSNGLLAIPVDIPADAKDVHITSDFQGVTKELTLGKSHSPSNSYIQLSLKSSSIKAGDSISFEIKGTEELSTLVYQVLSRGVIVKTGTINANNQKVFPFSVVSEPSMAPSARIVVYYVRPDGEVVPDSISFDISGAFNNKVSINLDRTDVEPGDNVTVITTADPDSSVNLLAIDQSVLLLKGRNDVTDSDVYSDLKEYDTIVDSSTSGGFRGGIDCPMCRRKKRFIWWPYPTFIGGSDAQQVLQNAGVVILTDATVYHYQEPIHHPIWLNFVNAIPQVSLSISPLLGAQNPPQTVTPTNTQSSTTPLKEVTRVRNVFSETFLWSDLTVGANGSASITATVPDTITSWVVSAFAINSNSGLGVAPTQAHLKVFRPFFVSLNLPYSVTRGEQLALQANVFNYLPDDMQVRVTLAKSNSFFNIFVDANGAQDLKQIDAVQDIFVKAGEAKSVYFPIVPADLGRIDIEVKAQSTKAADAVRRQLLVEAEGVPKQYNVPVLIDLTEGKTTFSKTIDLTLPANVVKGSELARISAVGDLMGPTIAGLDSLLQMPTGCGEQTMLGLAPDVYVTDYLESVNQLNGDVKTKAIGFMESGYQRELTYKHSDGSFSAFGSSDKSGSMWLTAFVARVFHQAKSHIFIDDSVLVQAIQWIIHQQNADGSFPEPGEIIHKNMQGQAGSGVGLTLFVLISLLENRDVLENTNAAGVLAEQARQKALAYAEQEVAKMDDLYVLAMASYAFQLAGSNMTQAVLDKLEAKTTAQDGMKYWHQPEPPKTSTNTWVSPNPTKAIDIEMTAYVLLTYTKRGNLVAGKSIMQWITKQRNANGGFTSTQDTVLALNALSEFAKQTYSNNFNVHITTQLDPTTTFTFDIDKTNSLLLQSRETTTVPAQVKVDASGSGMALVQAAVFFNVEQEIEPTTFDLTVKLIEETINNLFVETCARWLGEGPSSAMAVQEFGIPSGFEADLESITQLDILKRVETQNKKVILYFDNIGTTPVCLNIRVVRTGLVAKSQPAAVRVYDYYEPGNQVTAFYQSQLLKDSSVCDVCTECENCV